MANPSALFGNHSSGYPNGGLSRFGGIVGLSVARAAAERAFETCKGTGFLGKSVSVSSSSSNCMAGSGPKGSPPREVSEADLLCSEFLGCVKERSREGYQRALDLADHILKLEPENQLVLEYRQILPELIANISERVQEALRAAEDPNRTPSEVSTDESEQSEKDVNGNAEFDTDNVSEVATEPDS